MNKLNHLKKLDELVNSRALSTDEIRLYLLFLANCGKSNYGTVSYGTIKDICGNTFSTNKLKRACSNLCKHNLIHITFPPPDKITGKDYALTYCIECVPLRERGGRIGGAMTKVVDLTGKFREQREKKRVSTARGGAKKVNTRIESWTCPECGARHVGWSTLNICSTCGYSEASRP